MANIKRKWDFISKEYRKKCIREIIDFFQTEIEMDEEIGIIAAGNILNHFLQTVGLHLYNKGVEDSIVFLKERFEDLELDMEALLKK
ncbi:MAG: DUF2164 family protein [Candidatus Thorarchaeota archaeon]